jgi:hypothetical protein
MTKYAEISTADFPMVRVTFTGEPPTLDNFMFYLQELKQCYDQKQSIAILFDATNAVLPGTNFQKLQADWLKDNLDLMMNYCLGTGYVIPNLLIRNVLKAIFTFQKQPVPYAIYAKVGEAEQWVQDQLEKL